MESPLQTIERLQQQIRDLEAQLSAAQQAVQPSLEATSIAPTLMTNDQAIAWAWADVRKDVGTENWTTGDSCNFYGFFLYGWNYRGQYELQRNATKAAVMREIADTCDYELQQAPAHPAEGVPATAAVAEPDERAAFEAWLRVKPCGAAHDFGWAAWRARAAIAAAHPTQQGMDAPIIQALAAGISIQQWQSSVEILIGSSDLLVRAIASGKETRIELIRRAVSESLAAQAKQGGAA